MPLAPVWDAKNALYAPTGHLSVKTVQQPEIIIKFYILTCMTGK
jgi:hypothetical protein